MANRDRWRDKEKHQTLGYVLVAFVIVLFVTAVVVDAKGYLFEDPDRENKAVEIIQDEK